MVALSPFRPPALGAPTIAQTRPKRIQLVLVGPAHPLARKLVRVAREIVVLPLPRHVAIVHEGRTPDGKVGGRGEGLGAGRCWDRTLPVLFHKAAPELLGSDARAPLPKQRDERAAVG